MSKGKISQLKTKYGDMDVSSLELALQEVKNKGVETKFLTEVHYLQDLIDEIKYGEFAVLQGQFDNFEELFKKYGDMSISRLNEELKPINEQRDSAFGFEQIREYENDWKKIHNFLDLLISIKSKTGKKLTKIVKLRELAVVDTKRGWAHVREDGSIRRYYVSHVTNVPIVKGEKVDDIDTKLKKAIAKIENYNWEDIEFYYLPTIKHKYLKNAENTDVNSTTIKTALIPEELNKMMPSSVKQALYSQKHYSIISEYDAETTKVPWWVNLLSKPLHK